MYEDKPEQLAALIASEEEPSLSEVVQVRRQLDTVLRL